MNDQQDMITEYCGICEKVTLKSKFAAACPKCLKALEEEYYKEKSTHNQS